MRRLLAALLAVPVILTTYLPELRRRLGTQAFVALSIPVLLVGVSAVRMELAPAPVAAGVAGVSATPFPDAAFAPVSLAPAVLARRANADPGSFASRTRLGPAIPPDAPDSGILGGRSPLILMAPRATPVPAVVRFRPVARTRDVPAVNDVSVRFTERMDEAVTALTFTVSVNGKPVAARSHWAEGSTVLVLDPAKPFPDGATVTLRVSERAKSAAGELLGKAVSATFTVAKPAPKRSGGTTARSGRVTRIPRAVAPGLYGVELFALELMNCTRTGGWVRSDGTCRGAGSRSVGPLTLDAGISDLVARPYAYLLASRRLCNHFYDGNPGTRLRRAGYTNWDWAENVGGCGSNAPYASVLSTHLYFQSEKSYNGGHYRNMMNAKYDRVGIGIVKVNGVFRMVVNFYHP